VITLTDVTLRDGSHAVAHQFTSDQVEAIATALATAGVPIIEVSHGDGLGGSSLTYGRSKVRDTDLLERAAECVRSRGTRLAVLLLPGIGTIRDLDQAIDIGASVARIATHCTEADVAIQHLEHARGRGCLAVGFLMMAHMTSPDALAEQAKIHEAAGAQVVYCTDSAGAMTPADVAHRVSALRMALEDSTAVGFHAHNNLGLGVGNTLAAIAEGATYVDTSSRGLGAGAGNCATEALVAVCDKMGIDTGIDVIGAADVAEDLISRLPFRLPALDRASLILGWAGVYSSFLIHSARAAERYQVPQADILLELGRRGVVGGQEDMIVDVAIELSQSAAG
jgi:4-hydroxy-2-oxovalerate aldolase